MTSTRPVRLGAVGYLNARPLVVGLDSSPRFDLRFDVPSRCAELLHDRQIDVGLIPSIEYFARPAHDYRIVPDLAIASYGPVASVALYATRPMSEVRSIALDTSSRTSAALVRVLCARSFGIDPALQDLGPDLEMMLARCDAALMIGDNALFESRTTLAGAAVEKIDLGAAWTTWTGLPFVWAFWAGRAGALTAADIEALQRARDLGAGAPERVAAAYFPDSPERQRVGADYLRDNIKYTFGAGERAGLELFHRYAADAGLVPGSGALRFY